MLARFLPLSTLSRLISQANRSRTAALSLTKIFRRRPHFTWSLPARQRLSNELTSRSIMFSPQLLPIASFLSLHHLLITTSAIHLLTTAFALLSLNERLSDSMYISFPFSLTCRKERGNSLLLPWLKLLKFQDLIAGESTGRLL
jgi:hypothetical protein